MPKLLDYLALLMPRREALWSIGIYSGASPLALHPDTRCGDGRVLRGADMAGHRVAGVADPFMVNTKDGWCMFFEMENRRSGRGEIALARSSNAIAWQFEGVVLAEPFHLSYPQVLEHEGEHFMVPESAAAGGVRLYRAHAFPRRWEFEAELLRGDFADATLLRHDGRWWMFAIEGFGRGNAMVIFHADRMEGPWRPHARNPIARDLSRSRPAGKPVVFEGRLVRFAQDDARWYGRAVRAFTVDRLTEDEYEESSTGGVELLGPTGSGWNATGMHHVDAHALADGTWIACVDGRATRWRWPLADRIAARWPMKPARACAGGPA